MEIEAKFIAPNRATLEEINQQPVLAGYTLAAQKIKRIKDSYLDNAARDVYRAGYAFRRREGADKIVMTLKGLGGVEGAIHRREEVEFALPPDAAEADWHASLVYRRLSEITDPAELETLFQLEQVRIVRQLYQGSRYVAELSLDDVTIFIGGNAHHYYELETELSETGAEADLAVLAAHLQAAWNLTPSALSKFERALALI